MWITRIKRIDWYIEYSIPNGQHKHSPALPSTKRIFYSKFGRRLKDQHHAEIKFRQKAAKCDGFCKNVFRPYLANVPVSLGQARLQQ